MANWLETLCDEMRCSESYTHEEVYEMPRSVEDAKRCCEMPR
jgi:hypothetical protein